MMKEKSQTDGSKSEIESDNEDNSPDPRSYVDLLQHIPKYMTVEAYRKWKYEELLQKFQTEEKIAE